MNLSRTYQLLLLCAAIMSSYYSVLFAPLCYIDDTQLVFFDATGTEMHDLLSVIFSGGGYYRPLLFMTFVVDNYLWLLFESFLHLENVLLHLANALLLFGVLERLAKRAGLPEKNGVPFWGALLFGLHPLATESVNWISGRTDPLACLFLLLSLMVLLNWFEQPSKRRIILMQICFLLACLSKETAVFFIGPVVVLVVIMRSYNFESANRSALRTIIQTLILDFRLYAAFTVTILLYFAMRRYASVSSSGRDKGIARVTSYFTQQTVDSLWFDKVLEFFKTIGFYAKKMFVPWPLNFNIVRVSDWYAVAGLIVLAALANFCWRRRDLIAGLFLSSVLIASSALLVSIGKLAWTLYGERYLYIPLIFFIPAALFWLYEKIGQWREGQVFRVVLLFVFGASLVTTVQRNLVWMDRYALYEESYKMAPTFHKAIGNYAMTLRLQGRFKEADALMKQLPKKPKVAKGSVVK